MQHPARKSQHLQRNAVALRRHLTDGPALGSPGLAQAVADQSFDVGALHWRQNDHPVGRQPVVRPEQRRHAPGKFRRAGEHRRQQPAFAPAQGRQRRQRPQRRTIQAVGVVDQHRRHLLAIGEILENTRDQQGIGRAGTEHVAAGRNDVAKISRRCAIDERGGVQQPDTVQCRHLVAEMSQQRRFADAVLARQQKKAFPLI